MQSLDEKNLIAFAQIGRPHGIKGAFFLKTPDRRTTWDGYDHVLLKTEQGFESKKVLKSYLSGNQLALSLEGISSRETVETLYDRFLYVHKDDVPLEKDEFLVSELDGYSVYDSNQNLIGIVTGIVSFGAQDNLQIKSSKDGQEILYPFIDPFVISVDRHARSISIIYIPEFLDEAGGTPP